MRRGTATAVAGLVVSLAITAVLWVYVGSPVFFLFVPFVPVLLGGGGSEPTRRNCPQCDFSTADPEYDYCPRDGTRLETPPDESADRS